MTEQKAFKTNGFLAVLLVLVAMGGTVFFFINLMFLAGSLSLLAALLLFSGITVIQPNQAAVSTFFGRYMGSILESGLWMTVPLTVRKKVSLRVRNFNSAKLKVNDVEGNPVEIAAVVVFKVVDTAKALFDVDNYEGFV
jgi:regulator of protease activity HflC (stomatin/prohibitin superfamily)